MKCVRSRVKAHTTHTRPPPPSPSPSPPPIRAVDAACLHHSALSTHSLSLSLPQSSASGTTQPATLQRPRPIIPNPPLSPQPAAAALYPRKRYSTVQYLLFHSIILSPPPHSLHPAYILYLSFQPLITSYISLGLQASSLLPPLTLLQLPFRLVRRHTPSPPQQQPPTTSPTSLSHSHPSPQPSFHSISRNSKHGAARYSISQGQHLNARSSASID